MLIIILPLKNMEKTLEDDLIELSITSLLNCLEDSNIKDRFVKEIPVTKYQKIIKFRI